MDHDKGACVLHVALTRLLRQEVHKARSKHGVVVLVDMSTFYDTIQLSRLQEEAVKLGYPVLLLELAMQLYCGPKAILAEQEMTPFFHVDHGIPAGCPQAPMLAKVVLAPALVPWKERHPHAHLSSWVGGVGFGCGVAVGPVLCCLASSSRDLILQEVVVGWSFPPIPLYR